MLKKSPKGKKQAIITFAVIALVIVAGLLFEAFDACSQCEGTGRCEYCEGTGACNLCLGSRMFRGAQCIGCHGTGECSICDGGGKCFACD